MSAERVGLRIAAAGTHPFSNWMDQVLSPGERYQNIVEELQQLARSLLIFGLHIHVGIVDKQEALAIANQVRCPAGETQCLARTMFAQAYPYTGLLRATMPSSPQQGGVLSLARAIWQVLDDWRTARVVDSPGAPLVLNLSLGWDPIRYGTLPEDVLSGRRSHLQLLAEGDEGAHLRREVPVHIQAVHTALVYASCLDVLTLAAAGNRQVDGCDETGPLNPAQWERLAAPDRSQCEALFSQQWLEPPVKRGRGSLVYAVGGESVGAHWTGGDMGIGPNILAMTRPGSVPPRLAPASHATALWKGQQTEPWSGTSVASAAYAGLAAGLWTQRPSLSSHALVAMIDASGRARFKADFPSSTRDAKTIDGYAAFENVCASAPATRRCDANPYKKRSPDTRSSLFSAYRDAVGALPKADSHAGTSLQRKPFKLACGRTVDHYFPTGKTSALLTAPPLPWVQPQPQTPICPVCPLSGNTLILSVNPAAAGHWPPGPIKLLNTTLQLAGDSIDLGELYLGDRGLAVDLSSYTFNGFALSDALNFDHLDSGTLTIRVTGADGQPATMTSVVQVLRVSGS